MELYLQFLLLGIGTGAIIAALSSGMVLAYRASGVINLAHGAVAGYTAYVFMSLQRDGLYPIPPLPNPLVTIEWIADRFGVEVSLPNIPAFIDLGGQQSLPPAIVISLFTAAIVGLAFHFLVFRPLRYAPVLAKVVASVGLMLALSAAIVLRFGSRSARVDAILPNLPVEVLGVAIPADRFYVLAIVLALSLSLWAVFRYTRFGTATRAAAEDESFVTLLGFSADFQAVVSWIVASVLAGLVGILVAPITGLTPVNLTLLVIPAVAAALLGSFSSFWVATVAGLGLGMTQSLLFIIQERTWVPDYNLPQVLPVVVIAATMMLRGEVLPSRGSVERVHLPTAYEPNVKWSRVLVLVTAVAWGVIYLPFQYRSGLGNSMIGMILALSLVVVTGYVGQISLAQLALAGVSAFAIGTLGFEWGWPYWISLIASVIIGIGFGLVVALPSLRTRGASLAIITLAAAVTIENLFFRRPGFLGAARNKQAAPPEFFGQEFGVFTDFPLGDGSLPGPWFLLFTLVIATLLALGVVRLRTSRLGEQMLAVRANERAAAAAGVNTSAVKLAAFAISAGLAGTAGALKASQLGTFGASSFSILGSLSVLAFAYLGGITTVGGAMWAATLFPSGIGFVVATEVFDVGTYEAYIGGVLLVVTAVLNSEGIDGYNRRFIGWAKSKIAARRHEAVDRSMPSIREGPPHEDTTQRTYQITGPPMQHADGPVLQTRGLTVQFGGVVAVDGVDLDCLPGQLTGLIGPNGAGKTTLINAVTGFVASTGAVELAGEDVTGWKPHHLAHHGLNRTWQSLELFDDVSVRANLDVAVRRLSLVDSFKDYWTGSVSDERVDHVLGMLGLMDVADRTPRELSHGRRKMVGVARALVTRSTVLLLDEPAAGLDRAETVWFGEQLMSLVAGGYSMLLVDHDMSLVLTVCDRIHVLEGGTVIATGTPQEIRHDERVIAAYLGGASHDE